MVAAPRHSTPTSPCGHTATPGPAAPPLPGPSFLLGTPVSAAPSGRFSCWGGCWRPGYHAPPAQDPLLGSLRSGQAQLWGSLAALTAAQGARFQHPVSVRAAGSRGSSSSWLRGRVLGRWSWHCRPSLVIPVSNHRPRMGPSLACLASPSHAEPPPPRRVLADDGALPPASLLLGAGAGSSASPTAAAGHSRSCPKSARPCLAKGCLLGSAGSWALPVSVLSP